MKPSTLSAKTLQRLQSLCALLVEERPRLRMQVRRAYDLLLSGGVRPSPFNDGDVLCLSSDGVKEYEVGAGLCDCLAGECGKLCYHRIARRLYWVAQAEEARQANAAAVTHSFGADEYVRSGAQLAGVRAHEARINLAKKPSLNAKLGDLTQRIQEQNTLRKTAHSQVISLFGRRS